MIQPILSYTAEVWGILVDNDPTEKVHLFTCKKVFLMLQRVRLTRWYTANKGNNI